METATKTPKTPRSTDRLLEALATLAALLDRTISEVKTIEPDFQARLQAAVDETQASLQSQVAEQIVHVRQDVHDELTNRFQKELQAALDALRAEFSVERERLQMEVNHTIQAAAQLESERSGMIAEVQRVKDEAAATVERVRSEMQAAVAASAAVPQGVKPDMLREEIGRVEVRLGEIMKIIDDPATELSAVIRKNVEKSEIEAYIRGIRYAIDGPR